MFSRINRSAYITYEHFLSFPETQFLKVIAGESGLSREIRGGMVVEQKDAWNWIRPGDITFISGVGMENVDEELQEIIKGLHQKHGAGISIAIGRYIQTISKDVIRLCDSLDFPLMTLAYSVKTIHILERLNEEIYLANQRMDTAENILKNLICTPYNDIYQEQLLMFGYNERTMHVALSIHVANISEYILEHLRDNHETIMTRITAVFRNTFERKRKNFLSTVIKNEIVVLVDVKNMENWESMLVRTLEGCLKAIKESYPELIVGIGGGNLFKKLSDFRHSLDEARQAYDNLVACKKIDQIRLYRNIGVYQLLHHTDKQILQQFYLNAIAPIVKTTGETDNFLLDTLEHYLNCNCIISTTADEMYLHRNTVKYRISQIEEMLGRSLTDVNLCFNLRLAFKIRKYLSSSEEELNC